VEAVSRKIIKTDKTAYIDEIRIVLSEEVIDNLKEKIKEKSKMPLQFEFDSIISTKWGIGPAKVTLQFRGAPGEPKVTLGPIEKIGD
jgi:hypothetical protein